MERGRGGIKELFCDLFLHSVFLLLLLRPRHLPSFLPLSSSTASAASGSRTRTCWRRPSGCCCDGLCGGESKTHLGGEDQGSFFDSSFLPPAPHLPEFSKHVLRINLFFLLCLPPAGTQFFSFSSLPSHPTHTLLSPRPPEQKGLTRATVEHRHHAGATVRNLLQHFQHSQVSPNTCILYISTDERRREREQRLPLL